MTKMATIPIYGKNSSKIFSGNGGLISTKLGMKHLWLKYYNLYINHDPAMTLTQFMARSSWVAHGFEWGKLLKCHLKGKNSRELANGQNIDYSEKRKWPKGFIYPSLGLNTIIFKHVYWYMQQVSCEHLQDHWSSGLWITSEWNKNFIFLICEDQTSNTADMAAEESLYGKWDLDWMWSAVWENEQFWFPTRSDTNQAVQSQNKARSLKLWI